MQWDYEGQTLEDYCTKRLNTPGFQLPRNYAVKDGRVMLDNMSDIIANLSWGLPRRRTSRRGIRNKRSGARIS